MMKEIENLFENNSNAQNIQWIKNMENQILALSDGYKALTTERDLLKKALKATLSKVYSWATGGDVYICDQDRCGGVVCGSNACIELHMAQAREVE